MRTFCVVWAVLVAVLSGVIISAGISTDNIWEVVAGLALFAHAIGLFVMATA